MNFDCSYHNFLNLTVPEPISEIQMNPSDRVCMVDLAWMKTHCWYNFLDLPLHLVVSMDTLGSCVFHLRKGHKTIIRLVRYPSLVSSVGVISVGHQFWPRVSRADQVLLYHHHFLCADCGPSSVLASSIGWTISLLHRVPFAWSYLLPPSWLACDYYPLNSDKNP
jgi:hypothetical protein